MLEFGVRTRPPSRAWRIVVVKEMSCTLQRPVSGLPLTTTHSSSWIGRLIVIRTPATAFCMIWRDENATAIPSIPSDAKKAVSSKSRKYRALAYTPPTVMPYWRMAAAHLTFPREARPSSSRRRSM